MFIKLALFALALTAQAVTYGITSVGSLDVISSAMLATANQLTGLLLYYSLLLEMLSRRKSG